MVAPAEPRCPVPECAWRIARSMALCPRHWRSIPRWMKDEFVAIFPARDEGDPAAIEAWDAAIERAVRSILVA